jgi:drug/metabolite transporter (DMT)-like permease|tara:strand:- start:6217 stop:7116 length:900 start_codon:yes stop_codon:yes gene_type:complete
VPQQREQLINWALLLTLVVLWGTSFLAINVSLRSFEPDQVVVLRLSIATILLIAFMLARRKRLPRKPIAWVHFMVLGLLGNVLPFWFIAKGQVLVTSGMAGLLMAIMPLMTLILAHFFITGENLNRNKLLGFVFGIAGITLILGPSILGSQNSFIGCLLVLSAAILYATNSIIARRLPTYSSAVVGTGVTMCAALTSLMLWPSVLDIDWHLVSNLALLTIVWLGIFPTGVGVIIFFVLIRRAGPTFLSNINYLIPIVAYFTGALVLGELVVWHDMIALVAILFGIAVSRRPVRRTTHTS